MEKTTVLIKLTKAQKTQIEVNAKSEGKSVSAYLRGRGLYEKA
jgi:hypothetical protein